MEGCRRHHGETARNPQRPSVLTDTARGRVPRREPATEGRPTAVGSAGFAGAHLTAPGRPCRRHRRDGKLTHYFLGSWVSLEIEPLPFWATRELRRLDQKEMATP